MSAAVRGEDVFAGGADGPDVRCGSGGDAGQFASLPGARAWYLLPHATVPAEDQCLLRGAGDGGAHRPGAVRRFGGDRQQVVIGSRVRACRELPGAAVPVLDESSVTLAAEVSSHRPGVACR